MNEISQYQKVAALLALEIDLLAEMSYDLSHTELFESVIELKATMDKMIEDPEYVNQRYAAGQLVFGVAAKSGKSE